MRRNRMRDRIEHVGEMLEALARDEAGPVLQSLGRESAQLTSWTPAGATRRR
jgi:hypothetical protein